MADLTVAYQLTTPGGTIIFNNGELKTTTDLYWIQAIQGLDGAPIRAPVDNVAFGDGGFVHRFWKAPRRITFDGIILIQSVVIGGDCRAALNTMEEALRIALDSMDGNGGTLSWAPTGLATRSLDVKTEVALDIQPAENYAIRSFSFGLVAGNPNWV